MGDEGYSPRWKTHLPEFRPGRRRPSPTEERGRYKGVTMAPRSTYVTGGQYVLRKPLFSAEQHGSILKKTQTQKSTEEEKQSGASRQGNILTGRSPDPTLKTFDLPGSDIARADPGSPLGVGDLWTGLPHEGPPFGSPHSGSAQRRVSSAVLEVQRLKPPCRPLLTSTVLYSTCTPGSSSSKIDQTQLRTGDRWRGTGPHSSAEDTTGLSRSSHQANYWACAIPKALPPSSDRSSAGWDPNREYQALLDYTYPLRPGEVVYDGSSSKLWGDSPLQTDFNLQDSGIELDHLCSSTSLSGLDFSLSAVDGYPDLPGFNKSSDGPDPVALSLDWSMHRGGISRFDGRSSASTACPRSSSLLLHSGCVDGDVYGEFLPLPDQLSRRVREVTAELSRPVTNSWESLESGTISITPPEKREVGSVVRELEGNNQYTGEGKYRMDREDGTATQTVGSSGALVEPVRAGLSPSSLREVEVLAEQLCGLALPRGGTSSQDNLETSDSLMQHIQVFCSHLEQLVEQLYSASDEMELLAAPTVDIDSVKSSLGEFQREVCGHQPLSSRVLDTGRRLLDCINNTSPILRDTLLLIERRCGALECHNKNFFSSILSAMNRLTRPELFEQSPEEDPGPACVPGSAL
ncbi:centrosomal protein of 68 kDa isoform 1-T3 [Spinachia spinachia]